MQSLLPLNTTSKQYAGPNKYCEGMSQCFLCYTVDCVCDQMCTSERWLRRHGGYMFFNHITNSAFSEQKVYSTWMCRHIAPLSLIPCSHLHLHAVTNIKKIQQIHPFLDITRIPISKTQGSTCKAAVWPYCGHTTILKKSYMLYKCSLCFTNVHFMNGI